MCYSAKRRRLLSIVAWNYSQTNLTELFQCSKKSVTAARVHSILFGIGGVPTASLQFSLQCVSQEVHDQVADFLSQDDVSCPFYCRGVVVGGEECSVRYWQDPFKAADNAVSPRMPRWRKKEVHICSYKQEF